MYRIHVGRWTYRFEDHPWLGPVFLNEKDEAIDPKRVPLMANEAVMRWYKQGKRIDKLGYCIWNIKRKGEA